MDEINFDALAGPTHHFAGLSYGNLASMHHAKQTSNPKAAALQGLEKMKLLMDLGIPQGIIPPAERPSLFHLRSIGFRGSDAEVLAKSAKEAPNLFYAFCSSSSMWAANAATAAPQTDTYDGKLHLSIANLQTNLHRSIESDFTFSLFKRLFPDATIHPPLPIGGDEGAANHTRLSSGEHIFVYGGSNTTKFPARQTLEASKATARRFGLQKSIFLQQHPEAIDAGAFHNDVVATGHDTLYLYHEKAYVDDSPIAHLNPFKVTEQMLPLKQAIESYLFNSQIVTLKNKEYALIAPQECKNLNLSWLPIKERYFVNLSESMHNGGGPACLRLRIPTSPTNLPTLLTPELYQSLVTWVETHYRDRLTLADLADPLLLEESQHALDALSKLLLNNIYHFQRNNL